MHSIARKVLSAQFFLFLVLGGILGLSVATIAEMPNRLMAVILLGIAFPFVAFMTGDVRRFLMVAIVFAIPLSIDINFRHSFEEQAGAATMGIALRDIFMLLLLLWWLVEIVTSEERPVHFFARTTVPAIVYFEACLLTLLWAPRMDLAVLEIVQMIKVLLLYFIVANQIRDKRDIQLICWTLVASVCFESVIAILQMITGKSLALGFLGETQITSRDTEKMMRVGGTLGHPNRLALYLELLLPLCLGLFWTETKKKKRLIALVIFGLGFTALIVTGSRGAWIGVVLSLILFFYLLYRNSHVSLRSLIGPSFLALFILSVLVIGFSGYIERRISGEDHGSAISRIPMFQIAFSLIEAHPIGGVGINNYTIKMREYNDTLIGRRFKTIARPVHNMYLLITGETGVIGLFAFLWLLVGLSSSILMAAQSKDLLISITAIGLLAGLVAFLIHGFVDKHPPGGYPLFYCLMALAAALYYKSRHLEDEGAS
jgi:putative inorganic carbon (HCO3(-)) transporter